MENTTKDSNHTDSIEVSDKLCIEVLRVRLGIVGALMCLRMAELHISGLQHPLQFIYSSFVALSERAGEFLSSMEQFWGIQNCLFLTRFHCFNVDSVSFV